MASYEEIFTNKLDWAMPFQRTGNFPIDRSSIFSSYDDALAYAKQDGSDDRALGGTAYIGQIITVYGNGAGTLQEDGNKTYTTEVAAYIITGVGAEGASLQKLAQTTATGDFATDIANLQNALSNLAGRVTALENKETVVDTNTTYTFTPGVDTEGAIKVTTHNPDGSEESSEIQVKGWGNLVAIANGKTTAYVYQNKSDETYLEAIRTSGKFKIGDLIYFRDANISDQWVSAVSEIAYENGSYYLFTDLEVDHPDLSGYLTITDAANKYATTDSVSLKADKTAVEDLKTTVTNNKTATDAAIATNAADIAKLKTDLTNIDVSSQIDAKINELDVPIKGGTENSYIASIKQVDGKIEAVAATLPDYSLTYDAKGAADKALEDAKDYSDGLLVESKSYTDTEVGKVKTSVTSVESEVGTLKTTIQGHTTRIASAEETIINHTNKISNIETTVASNSSNISNIITRVESLETKVNKGIVSDVKVGGVKLAKDIDGAVNINSISTDLLTQGTQLLILDCLNASLTNN